jgi:KDO2-lipid IV(A) lauroyltransferase
MPRKNRTDWLDRLADRVFRGLIWLMHRLPWHTRIRTMGWLFAHVVGPIAGYGRRADKNLAMVFPEMSAEERRGIVRASLDNVGRTIIENYSPADQLRDVAVLQPRGPGLARHRGGAQVEDADRLRLRPFRQLAGGARGAEPARL